MPDPQSTFSHVFWTGIGAMLIVLAVLALFAWMVAD